MIFAGQAQLDVHGVAHAPERTNGIQTPVQRPGLGAAHAPHRPL